MGQYILEMNGICKTFSGNEVLHSVPFNLKEGEVHTLMGENGSGKSTLMKILMGIYQCEKGTIRLNEKHVAFSSPAQALEHGIAMIHQELFPVLDMEISENIFIGRELRDKTGILSDIKKMRTESAKLLAGFGIDLDPRQKMRSLSVGQCQLIEIVKAISCNAKIIIMDEPTSAITENEVEVLFKQIHRLREQQVSIIYISHKMEEIFKISDRISVLRDGNYIGTKNSGELNSGELIKMMVGRELSEVFPKKDIPPGDVILRVKNLSYGSKVREVSFEARRGEILGIAGLIGAGRSELVETLFGMRNKTGGSVEVAGEEVTIAHPKRAIQKKIALITEDRKQTGLNLRASLSNNITIVAIDRLSDHGLLNKKNEKEHAESLIKKLNIKSAGVSALAQSLSGGNQQKVVIAKWLLANSDIIIMDEPTRGIDVGAKRDIYLLMGELAEQGKAIIMISSELPEIIGMSDRIMVLCEGKVTGNFERKNFSQEKIMWCASGIEAA